MFVKATNRGYVVSQHLLLCSGASFTERGGQPVSKLRGDQRWLPQLRGQLPIELGRDFKGTDEAGARRSTGARYLRFGWPRGDGQHRW